MTSFLTTGSLSKIGKTKHHHFFLHFILLFFTASIFAQQDSATLQAVVIQATRTSSSSPVPHTNIKAAAIAQQQQAQDIPFLLSGVPSLVETSDAGAGVGYTGLRIRGSDPTRVNVTLNGVPFNDAESQGVFWVNMPDLASSAAEIQVQRGVGTSTNGAGAFGASVNIDLSKVSQNPFTQITNTLGSFGVRKHALQMGTGAMAGGKISFSGRLSTIHSDGYIDRATANLRALHLTGTYMDDHQSLQMHFLGGREITYQAWYGLPAQYYDGGTNTTYNVAGTERSDQPHPNEVDNYNQQHYLLHYKRNISSRLLVQLNGHYTRGFGYFEQYKANQAFNDYNLNNIPLGDTTITATDLIRRRWLDNHFYGTTWAIKYANGKTHFTFGGAASQYRGKHFGEVVWATYNPVAQGHRYYENDAVKNDANAYFQVETKHSSHFSSFFDLQLRHVNYDFLGFDNELRNVDQSANLLFFNPKAGLNYRFNARSEAYIFTGIGHREPNRDDFTQSTPNSRPKAEQLYNVETGIKTRQTNWSLSANLFGMYYRNQLVLSGRINDVGAYARTNVPTSYRTGLELEVTAQPISRLHFSGNMGLSANKAINFVEYRDNWSTGEQEPITYPKSDLAFSPNLIARAEANYDIIPANKKHALGITLSGKHVGRQFLDNTSNTNTQLPAFRFMDARLNYNLSLRQQQKIRFILAVNNVLNAKYASNGWVYRFTSPDYDPRSDDFYTRQESSGGIYHQAGYFPQAGTNWMMTVVVEF
jgi:iron complex outermembrane receptor protein